MYPYKVETALRKAVEKQTDFYQFAGGIDSLTSKFFEDKTKKEEFLDELATMIKEWSDGKG